MAAGSPQRRRLRSPLENAEKTLEQCLEGENLDELIKSLPEREKTLLQEIANEIRRTKNSQLVDKLYQYDYVRKPPTIDEFLEDPYWLGQVAKMTEDNAGVWPPWRKILSKDFNLDSRIHNVVFTGSLGGGKSFNAVVVLLYRLTLLSLMRNPHAFMGLTVGTPIIYVLISVSIAQVQDTVFGQACAMMSWSPYFKEELKFNPNSKYSGMAIDLSKSLQLNGGSKSQHIVGRNVPGIIMDEGNFRLEKNPNVRAYKLFNEVRIRIKNRFQRYPGFLPAISIIASSAADESSFTETIIKDIVKKDDPKTENVYSHAIYRIKNGASWLRLGADKTLTKLHANYYRPKWFKISYGLKNVAPKILMGWYTENGTPLGEGHENPDSGCKTELVPEDYRDDFDRDPINALQSLSGISIGGSYRLFTSLVDIEWAIANGEAMGLVNPCTVDSIPLSEEDDRQIWDYLDHPKFLVRRGTAFQPRRHPAAPRYMHLDLAKSGMAGLSVCHRIGWKEVENIVDRKTGKIFNDKKLLVEYDFILTIVPGRTQRISFEKIQQFIIWLRDYCGFVIDLVTADSYESFMQLQMLSTRGYKTAVLSTVKNKGPYYAWRAGFEEHRIFTFRQNWFVAEAEKLLDLPKQVDHPTEGDVTSNDTVDGMCGAYFNSINTPMTDAEAYSEPPIKQTPVDGWLDEKPIVQIEIPPYRRQPRRYVST